MKEHRVIRRRPQMDVCALSQQEAGYADMRGAACVSRPVAVHMPHHVRRNRCMHGVLHRLESGYNDTVSLYRVYVWRIPQGGRAYSGVMPNTVCSLTSAPAAFADTHVSLIHTPCAVYTIRIMQGGV
jgi:hypothetical protein